MSVIIKRKDSETPASFLFRATKRIQKSGVLLHARRNRFHKKKVSKAKIRVKAMHSLVMDKEMKKFQRLGYSQEESVNLARRIMKGIARK